MGASLNSFACYIYQYSLWGNRVTQQCHTFKKIAITLNLHKCSLARANVVSRQYVLMIGPRVPGMYSRNGKQKYQEKRTE